MSALILNGILDITIYFSEGNFTFKKSSLINNILELSLYFIFNLSYRSLSNSIAQILLETFKISSVIIPFPGPISIILMSFGISHSLIKSWTNLLLFKKFCEFFIFINHPSFKKLYHNYQINVYKNMNFK